MNEQFYVIKVGQCFVTHSNFVQRLHPDRTRASLFNLKDARQSVSDFWAEGEIIEVKNETA